jgi:hypothetical protein
LANSASLLFFSYGSRTGAEILMHRPAEWRDGPE